MQDMTQGSVTRHIVQMAAPIAIGMLFQTLYYLIDLYFVSRLGDTAIAGVGSAGNFQFIILALTQVLSVGTMVMISHASGRKDQAEANLVFNQSISLSVVCSVLTLLLGYGLCSAYMRTLGADLPTIEAGETYLYWFLPGLALQFPMSAMGSGLRGTGIAKPTMVVQMLTVILNAVLAPVLIAGWVTGHPMGVAGAGLATSISVVLGTVLMLGYFRRYEKFVGFDAGLCAPRPAMWGRILRIGLPPGGEFALMFVYMVTIYWVIRGFGAEAQAGFSIGIRVMQAIFLPAMAVAFATAPVAGQNMGAGHGDRVRATFRSAAIMGTVIMIGLTTACRLAPQWFIRGFSADASVIAVGGEFLHIISWNFIASGLIFTCSGMFQALGNTIPALMSSASRLLTFVIPAVWLSMHPGFQLHQIWYLSVASVAMQGVLSLYLLAAEFDRRLAPAA